MMFIKIGSSWYNPALITRLHGSRGIITISTSDGRTAIEVDDLIKVLELLTGEKPNER